jgi:uncharacterized protein
LVLLNFWQWTNVFGEAMVKGLWVGAILAKGILWNFAGAASFDCKNAGTTIELKICENAELEQLDEKLAGKYREKLKNKAEMAAILRDQRNWLRDVRNKCQDTACLVAAYRGRMAQIDVDQIHSEGKCPVVEADLFGNWKRIKNGDFEEFGLSKGSDRNFSSWLHGKPEMFGRWDLKGCVISIVDLNNEKITFDYKLVKFQQNEICFEEVDEKKKSCYGRIKN